MIKAWWGPKTFTTPVAEIDLRVGGKYLTCMRSADGQDFWSTGIYKVVDPPAKLVMTDSFADEKGNVVSADYYGMNPDFPLEGLDTVVFEEKDGRSTFTLTYSAESAVPESDIKDMQNGWLEMFDKLEAKLADGELC